MGAFDDLIPESAPAFSAAGTFDDLIPKNQPAFSAKGSFDDLIPKPSIEPSTTQIPRNAYELGAQNFQDQQSVEAQLKKQSGLSDSAWAELVRQHAAEQEQRALDPDTATTTAGAAGVSLLRTLASPKSVFKDIGVDTENYPSGVDINRAFPSIPKSVASPVASVGKAATGLAEFITSPSGIAQTGLSLTPVGAVQRAKWIYDLASGAGTSAGNLSVMLPKALKNPGAMSDADLQALNDEAINAASSLYMAGKMTEHEFTTATGLKSPAAFKPKPTFQGPLATGAVLRQPEGVSPEALAGLQTAIRQQQGKALLQPAKVADHVVDANEMVQPPKTPVAAPEPTAATLTPPKAENVPAGNVEPQTPHPQPSVATATAIEAKPTGKPTLIPALLVDGKPLTGEGSHADIARAHLTEPGVIEALSDDSKHVFVDESGKVYDRHQAQAALGLPRTAKGLHSQDLPAINDNPPAVKQGDSPAKDAPVTAGGSGEPASSVTVKEKAKPQIVKPEGELPVSPKVQKLRDMLLTAPTKEKLLDLMAKNNAFMGKAKPHEQSWLAEAADIRGKELEKSPPVSRAIPPASPATAPTEPVSPSIKAKETGKSENATPRERELISAIDKWKKPFGHSGIYPTAADIGATPKEWSNLTKRGWMDKGWPGVLSMKARFERDKPTPPAPAEKPAAAVQKVASPMRAAAKEFHDLAMSLAPEKKWVSEKTLDAAMSADAGKNNLGTMGIKGNIERGKAIKKVWEAAAKELGLDPAQIGRESYRATHIEKIRTLAKQAGKFAEAVKDEGDESGKISVESDELKVGETLDIGGEKVKVVAVRADHVELEDGRKFGKQTVPNGKTLYVEGYEPHEESKPALSLEMEGDAQRAARESQEATAAKTKADKERLAKLAAKPLIGSSGDIGQRTLTGEGDLLSGDLSSGNLGKVGMGGAKPAEFSNPTIEDLISGNKLAPPREKPAPTIEPQNKETINALSEAAKSALESVKGWFGAVAGKTFPKTTLADRQLGELGARWISSRIAAKPKAEIYVAEVLGDSGLSARDVGAALTEDNLRSIKAAFGSAGDERAGDVQTLIGKPNSPFKTEREYQDFISNPKFKEVVERHKDLWQATVEPQYREAMRIDPDVELPSRGLQTGARVNLRAVQEGDNARNVVRTVSPGNLLGTMRRKSPFGVQATGAGEAYHTDLHDLMENTFGKQDEIANKNAFEKKLVDTGNAIVGKPGQQVNIKGQPAVPFPLQRQTLMLKGADGTKAVGQNQVLYVNRRLATEYRIGANVDFRPPPGVLSKVNAALNKIAIASGTEATTHVMNLGSALFALPTTGAKLMNDSLLTTFGRADIPVKIVQVVRKSMQDNRAQLAGLSEIGAMKEHYEPTRIWGMRQGSQLIQWMDKNTRLVLDDAYQNLAKQGLVEDSETARREFVNQVGQYNMRAQPYLMGQMRKLGISPFVTAGKNFNALAVREATLSPGVKASSVPASIALKVNLLSKWVGSAAIILTANYLLTKDKGGGVMGRPGTPLGNVDTGSTDKNGRNVLVNVLNITGQGRALRVTGLKGFIDAERMGLPASNGIDTAGRDIINSAIGPWAGPAARFAVGAASGYPTAINVGRAYPVTPPGQSQHLSDFKNAVINASPIGGGIQKMMQPQGQGWWEIVKSQFPRLVPQAGRSASMNANYPEIVQKAQANGFMEDVIHAARSVPPDQRHDFLQAQISRLPAELQSKAWKETEYRRVMSR